MVREKNFLNDFFLHYFFFNVFSVMIFSAKIFSSNKFFLQKFFFLQSFLPKRLALPDFICSAFSACDKKLIERSFRAHSTNEIREQHQTRQINERCWIEIGLAAACNRIIVVNWILGIKQYHAVGNAISYSAPRCVAKCE